jgi:hypothetical protein
VDAGGVVALGGPDEFYTYLRAATVAAERRVVLASLYIGTGPLETSLLETLAEACRLRPALQATLLLDALRSQRLESATGHSRYSSQSRVHQSDLIGLALRADGDRALTAVLY